MLRMRVSHVPIRTPATPAGSRPIRASVSIPRRSVSVCVASHSLAPCKSSVSISAKVPRKCYATEPVRLSDEYTYFAEKIQKRAVWERARNWAMFIGTAAAGSVLAEVTLRMAEVVPPDSAGTGLAFGGVALGSAALQWGLMKLQGVKSIPTSMGGRLANPAVPEEKFLRDTVHELSKAANLSTPPDVYIIPTEDMNAFAAGTRPGSQVAAATTGLLRVCTQEEIRAVMAHEVGHLRNGDGKTALQMIAMNAGFFAVLRMGTAF